MIKTGIYKHFKGGTVLVYAIAERFDATSEMSDNERYYVVYRGIQDRKDHTRLLGSFIDLVENKDGKMMPRFELVKEIDVSSSLNKVIDENTL